METEFDFNTECRPKPKTGLLGLVLILISAVGFWFLFWRT